MRITEEIAREVIERIYPVIGKEISITNEKGVVVGSTDPRWIGQTYKEAIEVINRKEIIEVEDKEGEWDSGTNFPIFLGSEVIGVLWVTGRGEHIRDLGRIACVTIELLLMQRFAQTLENLRKQALDSFISSFLRDSYYDWEDIASYVSLLGYDLFLPRFAVAIGIPEYGVAIRNALRMMEESLATRPLRYDVKERVINICKSFIKPEKGDIIAHVGGGLFMILKVEDKHKHVDKGEILWLDKLLSRLENEMKVSAYAGIGSCANAVAGLRASFREALSALEIGILFSRFGVQGKIFFYEDPMVRLGTILRSADSKLRACFVKSILKDILKDKELLDTIRVYIASDMNASVAAQSLFIHKNTLFYRLRKIRKLTGFDPQKPTDAFYLWLALWMEPLLGLYSSEQGA